MARYLIAVVVLALAAYGYAVRDTGATALDRAEHYLELKKYSAARSEVDAAVKEDPTNLATYIRGMGLYGRHERYSDEAELGELLIEQSRRSVLNRKLSAEEISAIYSAMGSAYSEARDVRAAEKAYRNALDITPDKSFLLNDLGYLYADNGIKLREALRLTAKAVELIPDNGVVLDSLGWALYRNKRYKSALKTLKQAVELAPDQAELRYHLGAVYANQGRRAEARIELAKALILDPNLYAARKLLRKLAV